MAGRRHVHVAGVGGVGMSALAQALRWDGSRVTGSDRFFDRGEDLPVFAGLRAAGVELTRQDGSAISADTAGVAFSTAIEADNADLRAAERLGVPVKHRSEWLEELARGKKLLAVAGTAGKTTTTGMLAHALVRLGADPTVVNGGALVEWAEQGGVGNARKGGGEGPWVLELDESDRSLLRFEPSWSILTNVSQDHFSLEEVRELFRTYAGRVKEGVVCGPGAAEVVSGAGCEAVGLDGVEVALGADGAARALWRGVEVRVPQPGLHNAWNAVCAAELCARLGYGAAETAAALRDFGGMQRRLEATSRADAAVRVLDDYAHNPAKIRAAWAATAGSGTGRVLGVWRPHGYGPLRSMMEGLAAAFAESMRDGDRLWLLPVFDAGGTADRSVASEDLLGRLAEKGVRAEVWKEGLDGLAEAVAGEAAEGDSVLVMGARDPGLPKLARRVAALTGGGKGAA